VNAALPCLPALRSLGNLADKLPVITVDSREQTPLVFTRLPSARGTLYSADYSVAGLETTFAVERKSIPDLVQCCTQAGRERFENELHRLRGFRFKRLLIVGTREEVESGLYRSKITPAAVLGSLSAWEIRFDCPVVWEATPEDAARRVEGWAWYFAREHVRAVNDLFKGAGDATKTA
jgi:DNA excision repair protein ERCC-4